MFCYQCEQTFRGTGCTEIGVCGKDETTADLQDLLLYITKGISMYAHRARAFGAVNREIDVYVTEALFTTVTNVNFDPERLEAIIQDAVKVRSKALAMYEKAAIDAGISPEKLDGPATLIPAGNIAALIEQAKPLSIAGRKEKYGEDIVSLQEIITYGIKGAAAYADHAIRLGFEDAELFGDFHKAMDMITHDVGIDELIGMALEVGRINYRAMEILDKANTETYGHPEPTSVRIEHKAGKAILVSGHDLKDLEELLKQTEGKGINVYTHGEMLPANSYPKLKAYPHLAGNYGGPWQIQAMEFDRFPGAILMTTNCIQKPLDSYEGRLFTCGMVAWPGVTHIGNRDFSPVIDAALAAPGFPEDGGDRSITVGFGRNAVLAVAGTVVEAVKSGALKHFFLIGGCDGAKPGRSYFTDMAKAVPDDCVILTLACGKYRFNKLDFGTLGGIPRLLDVGQCNDAYSAIQIALALSNAFNCSVNELPLSMVLSWYEQKAVAILLTLLYLGVENIRLGPTLPAFVSPNVLNVLVEKFHIMPVTTPEEDLKAILN